MGAKSKYNSPILQCHIGGRKQNQDFVAQSDTALGKLLITCDGVGGNSGGAIASQEVALYLKEKFSDEVKSVDNVEVDLKRLVHKAHLHLLDLAKKQPKLKGMATTLVMALINKNTVYVVHVGDSRFTLFRKGQIIGATKDHSYVQKLVDQGHLTLDESIHHPRANEISRALGIENKAESDVSIFQLKKGDRILLTSDGVHGVLNNQELNEILIGSDAKFIVDFLVAESNSIGAKRSDGQHDNIGVIYYEHRLIKSLVNYVPYLLSIVILCLGLFLIDSKLGIIDDLLKSDQKLVEPSIDHVDNNRNELDSLVNSLEGILTTNMIYVNKSLLDPVVIKNDNEKVFKKSMQNLEEVCEFENDICQNLKINISKKEILFELDKLKNFKQNLEKKYEQLIHD